MKCYCLKYSIKLYGFIHYYGNTEEEAINKFKEDVKKGKFDYDWKEEYEDGGRRMEPDSFREPMDYQVEELEQIGEGEEEEEE